MNRGEYQGDPRYRKVLEQMDLLGIMDVSTTRQSKNGTITWKLPIRNTWKSGKFIEVASFKSGMVRNNNSGYSNYQLNKCKSVDKYFKHYDYENDGKWSGRYNKYTCKERILIPIEIDRLEYLLKYCVKNYYIKHANLVPNGNFVAKWKHEWELEQLRKRKEEIRDHFLNKENDCGHYERIRDLENKLDTIQRVAEYK